MGIIKTDSRVASLEYHSISIGISICIRVLHTHTHTHKQDASGIGIVEGPVDLVETKTGLDFGHLLTLRNSIGWANFPTEPRRLIVDYRVIMRKFRAQDWLRSALEK